MRKSHFVSVGPITKIPSIEMPPMPKKKKNACKKLERKHAQMRKKKSVQLTTSVKRVASMLKTQLVPTLENCATYPFDLNCILCVIHNQASVLAHTPTTRSAIKW